jgi:outer membrane receptor protein involved in Fe transport
MKTLPPSALSRAFRRSGFVVPCALLLGLAASAPLRAQTVATPAAPPAAGADVPVTLSPFEVMADATDTYDATNTNSITGTNTPLNRTPLDARVFNRTMMDEMDIVDVAGMLSTFGGLGVPMFSSGTEDQRGMQEGDTMDYKSMTSRGLTISNPRRDGFLRSDTSLMDSFDVESAEALQGSNSLLFGSGDAGGVININSKRARLRQNFGKLSARFDSEGSERYTADLNGGTSQLAVRVNAVKGRERFDRPLISLKPEGYQVALTFKPRPWLGIYGDVRRFTRDHIRPSNATVRVPTTFRLNNGEAMDQQLSRYITGLGGSALINDFITLTNQDSITGAYTRHYYDNKSKGLAVELTPSADLAFQFRYGHDDRANNTTAPSSTSVFHPDATGNQYRDENGVLRHVWAMNTTLNVGPSSQGTRGYKFTGVYHRDLGRWGDHRLNAFYSKQESWNSQYSRRFYEVDANGNIIQNLANITNSESGRNVMPAIWIPAFPESLVGNIKWPATEVMHPNGKRYKLANMVYEGAVTPTANNPLGLSGPINPATGQTSANYVKDDTDEESVGFSAFSSWWGGRVDTMAGFRFETADTRRTTTGVARGPIDYNSTTLGAVFDTPVKGVRGYANYATNAKINFGADTDIYNQTLPIGKGVSREAGLKFSLWDHRLSGNLTYYISEAQNFTGTLGAFRDDVDPDGINGRNGGQGFTYNKKSDGLSAALSVRPLRFWEVTLSYTQANGSERSNVRLPILYNDEFNTTTVNGQSVVAVKGTGGALTALTVPSDIANPNSPRIPLSLAMMRDRSSPYYATLDPDSGRITNAQQLGLLTTGVGTARTGLPISSHQLGFVPTPDTIVVRQAGESTTGYAEDAFSLINRFQVREGRLRGVVFGFATSYRLGIRGYNYTDAADGGKRKIFYYPDQLQNNVFALYTFKLGRRLRATVQANVSNVTDEQKVVALPRSTNGTIRYFAYQYSPRKVSFTTSIAF